MKIQTKLCGEREIISKEEVEGVPGLFRAEIMMEEPVVGFIDQDNNEVVPFGSISVLEHVTALDRDTVVIDKSYTVYKFKQWWPSYGSVLVVRKENGFESLFESNFSTFNIDDEKLIGAYVDPDDQFGSIITYLYNYKTKEGIRSAMDRWAFDAGRLDGYLNWKVSERTPLSRRLFDKNSF